MSASLTDLAMACTTKQRAFANELAAGTEQSEAYRRAFGSTRKDKGLASLASHCRKKPSVMAYLAALVGQQERARFLTRDRKREKLALIVEGDSERTADRLKAIEVDNVMNGDNKPQQVEVFGLSDLLALVRKRRE